MKPSHPPQNMSNTSFQMQCKLVKRIMNNGEYQNKTSNQLNEALQNRIKKFYSTNQIIQIDCQHFKPRLQPLYINGVQPSLDTLVLFGIDFMKKKQLNQYFGRFNPSYVFYDESNCIINFNNKNLAFLSIKQNVKHSSPTHIKIQQLQNFLLLDNRQNNISSSGHCHPRQWIQLKQYKFAYKKNRYNSRQYSRKLYIRYATNIQKQAGFNQITFLQYMINKCKNIWNKQQSKQNNKLKIIIQKQINKLNQTKKYITSQNNYQNQQYQRYRSRQNKKNRYQQYQQKQKNIEKNRNPLLIGTDQDLNMQIRSRSQCSNVSRLIQQFSILNLNNTQPIQQNKQKQGINRRQKQAINRRQKQIINSKYKQKIRNIQQLQYKVSLPTKQRYNINNNNKFNYKQYVKKSIESQEKQIQISYCDIDD